MLVRLYNFDGKAVTTEKPLVVSYDERTDRQGNRYRIINNWEELSSYQEALEYIESQESSNHSIVGSDPFNSPISLEAVQNYKRAITVYQECRYRHAKASALTNLTLVYTEPDEMQEAPECYEQALDIVHKMGDRHNEGTILGSLGGTYAALGDVQRAIGCYRQALGSVDIST